MNEEEKQRNRDLRRSNHANAATRGCIYSEINSSCIKTLMKDIDKADNEKLTSDKVKELLLIAKECNDTSKKLLVSSQTSIGRRTCTTYASKQLKQMQSAQKNKEAVEAIKSISQFIVQEPMIQMTNRVVSIDQSGMS